MVSNKGKLFLIPNIVSENTHEEVINLQIKSNLKNIRHFLAEDVRTARRFLSSLKVYDSIESLDFQILDKDTKQTELKDLFKPINEGLNLGIISESGCPGVADPGALAVGYAHQNQIQVVPLVGPSSILLALMASGLNGQQFCFHGYLPIESKDASKVIKDLEKESRSKNQTQIFIETPYRNNSMMQNLLTNLSDTTYLCRAVDVTGTAEDIKTLPVKSWKSIKQTLPKLPVVFLFLAC
jgi:16S rRNA (cytidine1402-2'-O)-methyltransferase